MHALTPHVLQLDRARHVFVSAAEQLATVDPHAIDSVRDRILRHADGLQLRETSALQLRIALSVLCDLRSHDWIVTVIDGLVHVAAPDRDAMDSVAHKEHVRTGLLLERNAQLRDRATRRFVATMETKRIHRGDFKSVLSLLRDGPELAAALGHAAAQPAGVPRLEALRTVLDPYIQVVESGVKCPHTGLDLQDIWRYFRHTWVTPYRSVPGRQISFLVRDRAVVNHPVIGIGSLASSVVQQKQRDKWIGWQTDAFLEAIEADDYRGWSTWINTQLNELLAGVYIQDFVNEGVLRKRDLTNPTKEIVLQLRRISKESRAAHRLYRQEEHHKRVTSSRAAWRRQAQTHLFRSKRAGRLAELLNARIDLTRAGFTAASPKLLRKVVSSASGRRAITTILRLVKASHVGIDMMDISVCGALAPYGPILGGKLTALLLASPSVVSAYAKRYGDASSVIASSMAGRPVHRSPRLVLLMTTSLYRVASSQYNRLKVPSPAHGGEDVLQYIDLDHTAGFGSYHFSKATMEAMEVLLARAAGGREVNSIFGEGVNPKLRKVRSALHLVGLPAEQLLKHGAPRIVYGVPLASNFRDVLVGRARRPHYIVPHGKAGTERLVDYWMERWLSQRIEREGVLDAVAEHSTAHPLTHGARVCLPTLEPEEHGPLFAAAVG